MQGYTEVTLRSGYRGTPGIPISAGHCPCCLRKLSATVRRGGSILLLVPEEERATSLVETRLWAPDSVVLPVFDRQTRVAHPEEFVTVRGSSRTGFSVLQARRLRSLWVRAVRRITSLLRCRKVWAQRLASLKRPHLRGLFEGLQRRRGNLTRTTNYYTEYQGNLVISRPIVAVTPQVRERLARGFREFGRRWTDLLEEPGENSTRAPSEPTLPGTPRSQQSDQWIEIHEQNSP